MDVLGSDHKPVAHHEGDRRAVEEGHPVRARVRALRLGVGGLYDGMHLAFVHVRPVRLADDLVRVALHALLFAVVDHGVAIAGDRHDDGGGDDRERGRC